MQRLINSYGWFALNAALVAGLIVLATLLQGRSEPAAPEQQTTTASTSTAVQGLILSPQKTQTVAPAQRPGVRGGGDEREYDDD